MRLSKPDVLLELDADERNELCAAIGLVVAYYEQSPPTADNYNVGRAHDIQEAFIALERLWTVLRKK